MPILEEFYQWLIEKEGAISAYFTLYYGILGQGLFDDDTIQLNLDKSSEYQEWLNQPERTITFGESDLTIPPEQLPGYQPPAPPEGTTTLTPPPLPATAPEEQPTVLWSIPAGTMEEAPNGIIAWSDGSYTEAFPAVDPTTGQIILDEGGNPQYRTVVEVDALAAKSKWDFQLRVPEEPQVFGDMEIISEGGYDWAVIYDESEQPIGNPQFIGRTEDQGTSEYESALIDIQQQQVDIQAGRLELDIRRFEEMTPYEAASIGLQRAQLELLMKPYEQLTFAEQAQFDFDERVFEEEKRQWGLAFANLQEQQEFGKQQQAQEFAQRQFEFGNLSAFQESERELGLRGLGLQERQVQADFQRRPMDWLSAWQFSNPTWAGQPRGTPNPEAQPFLPIPQGGFPPPQLPQGVGSTAGKASV